MEGATNKLIEGHWSAPGPSNILGGGTSHSVTISKIESDWMISFESIEYHSRAKQMEPTKTKEGPYKVTVSDGVLRFMKDSKWHAYSFSITKEALIMPAILLVDEEKWIYKSPKAYFKIECEHNPFEIPAGKIKCAGLNFGDGFYSFEVAPRNKHSQDSYYFRLLEQIANGYLIEKSRLKFSKNGPPRYEKLIETGQPSSNEFPVIVYLKTSNRELPPTP